MSTPKEYVLEIDRVYAPNGRIEIIHGKLVGGRGAETPVIISVSGRSNVYPFDPRCLSPRAALDAEKPSA